MAVGFRFRHYKGDPAGTRTQGPYIKSVLLYQLSYEIISCFGIAKIATGAFPSKIIWMPCIWNNTLLFYCIVYLTELL